MHEIIIVPAEVSDSRRLWEIRYHPRINAASVTRENVSFADHHAWFLARYFGGQANYCFVAKDGGRAVGYCRLDESPLREYSVSIALDPAYHGRGIGTRLLGEALCRTGEHHTIRATIQKNNLISLRLFQRHGFAVEREDALYMHLVIM